jgi:Zn-dependent peptidase ImmA (M78 family)
VVTQHQRAPFKKRLTKNQVLVEKQAHIFAAEFLAPVDLARKCGSAEEIRNTFKLSQLAATRRLSEIDLLERSKQFGRKPPIAENPNEATSLEDHTAIICAAILQTISEDALHPFLSFEPLKNNLFSASTATAKAAQLLLDAYESVRGVTPLIG